MSVEWMGLQEQYTRNQGIHKAGYIWDDAVIAECLLKKNIMVEVWETRNQDVRDKKSPEKQEHRRKQKFVDLQKEKEYVQDPEQFIEQSSTNHLEN